MENKYENGSAKRLAVITGASSGIGFELATQFAQNGFDLIICSSSEKIYQAANALREFGCLVHEVQADLRRPDGVEKLYSKIKSISCPVDSLVVNAGVGVGGASFDKTELGKEIEMINLNIISSVHLTKLVLKDMVEEGHGRILITSSVAAIMPGPYEAVYAGTKAFLQFFSEALRVEMKDKGITVTALLPGPTETDFFHRADMEDTQVGISKKDSAAQVAEQGYKALMNGEDMVVAGSMMNKVQTAMAKVMPQSVAAKMHGRMSKPNSPEKR